MKYTIEGFSQKKLIELGLDCTDAVMIRYILDFYNSDKMCKVVVDGVEYFWLKYAYVIEQIPIIGIKSKDGLYRRMKKYAKCGLLIHHTHRVGGTYSCYRFNGPVLYQLGSNSDTSDEKSEGYGSEVGGGTDEKSEQKILLSEKINLSDNTDAVASSGGSASEHEQSKQRGEAPTTAGPSSADFFERFKEVTGKNLRVMDEKFKRQFRARIKEGFTLEEMVTATRNAFASEHHQKNRQYLTPEFITRADKLQTWLYSAPDKPNNIPRSAWEGLE